ncbi:hypothetical protein [Hyphomicrobium sp. CS1GBMeth3]|uniref:hypothetical protein n=1 Tax=Hyphomicrobium sp. CS1GBMeth3 TaxID=1892845 RepID=UPI0009318F58|nr:hypothetical protein [Hyphomicrobium sp. CS1GBMeth3]
MFDQVPPSSRSATGAGAGRAEADDAKALIERELIDIVRWHLAREASAAEIIQRLSYKLDQGSELAERARGYAGRLKLLVARIGALLPGTPVAAPNFFAPGVCSEMIIQSLDAGTARRVLMQFLQHHAPIPSATLISAGERLRSKGFDKLWQRVAREREKIASWLEVEVSLREGPARSPVDARGEDRDQESFASETQPASHASQTLRDDEETGNHMTAPPATARIFYNPPQIVKWM